MAFNGLIPAGGIPYLLSYGESTCVGVSFEGQDKGAIWIMADPMNGGSLQVSNATKTRVVDESGATVTYWTTVTCVAGSFSKTGGGVNFSVQGGGNT